MARKLATIRDITVGGTVFTSRTGQVSRTVVALDLGDLDRNGDPLVIAQREGNYMESVFAVYELWVEVPR